MSQESNSQPIRAPGNPSEKSLQELFPLSPEAVTEYDTAMRYLQASERAVDKMKFVIGAAPGEQPSTVTDDDSNPVIRHAFGIDIRQSDDDWLAAKFEAIAKLEQQAWRDAHEADVIMLAGDLAIAGVKE